ncbi:MAG: hypothetical protein NZ741_13675, partial [Armatimonadetes bacterium]|nr:hypothetical protein [Armatimonadota bacterium]
DLKKLFALAYDIAVQGFLMIVCASVDDDGTDAKELVQLLQGVEAASALRYCELMEHLYSGFVAFAVASIWLIKKADGEATFAVYKPDDPSDED